MRTLIKVAIPAEAGNAAIRDGRLPKVVGQALERLKPEAAYFTVDGGLRTAFFVVDLKDSSDMPWAAEQFFMELQAKIDFTPVMSAEDLKKGLARIS